MNDAVFRALSDPSRREILRLLRAGPRTSGQIASHFDAAWPTISRHLAILRDASLVIAERQGQEIHYELNTSVFQDLIQHLMDWSLPRRSSQKTTAAKTGRPHARTRQRTTRTQEV